MKVELPEDIFTADITVSDRLRRINEEKVVELANSIKEVGLINPIVVRSVDEGRDIVLVAGAHRLAAVKQLGMNEVRVVFVHGDDVDCRLWEIAENLHRAELTKLERTEQIEEWRRLTASKVTQLVSPVGGSQPKEIGVRATARELGVSQPEVQRSAKIAGLTEEAKEAAREAGIDDNQSALLKVASYADEDQVEAVAGIVAEKATKPKLKRFVNPGSPSIAPTPESIMADIRPALDRLSLEGLCEFNMLIAKYTVAMKARYARTLPSAAEAMAMAAPDIRPTSSAGDAKRAALRAAAGITAA